LTKSRIVTLTLNPSVDLTSVAEKIRPIHKIRTESEAHDPGGGGINVSRVVKEFGGETLALMLAGGATGHLLEELLDGAGVPRQSIAVQGFTRISQTVLERSTGLEYRFVPEGPLIADSEWQAALGVLETVEGGWLVCSGSLPRGVPVDFYARAARIAAGRGMRFVLDTSGQALIQALEAPVDLIKPSLSEFQTLAGRELKDPREQEEAAAAIIRSGRTRILAVTLGADGAILATEKRTIRLPALPVEVKGAVGAGDSFLAAMVMALSRGAEPEDAFAWGMAAGAAAVSNSGTAHPREADVRMLRQRIALPPA
jgi:6-phosphofructokinase 2